MSIRDKVLSTILGLLILATIGTIVYVISSPSMEERFTEFYILGAEAKAKDYPTELVVGEEGTVFLAIVNHEYQEMAYWVVIRIGGSKSEEIGPVVLEHEAKWEQAVSFIPREAGENEKVEFLLFKEGEGEPYESLFLWLDVKEKG